MILFYTQLFALAWSPDGTRLATFAKDHRLRIFDPRGSSHAVVEGEGPIGSRGGRIVWLEQDTLLVSGFNRYSSGFSILGEEGMA